MVIMTKKGFSTLEILIATAVLTVTLSAVIIVSFSSQSFMIDSKNGNDGLNEAQALLEEAKNSAKIDFDLVQNKTETNGIFTKQLTVTEVDAITKKISAEVTWQNGEKKVDLYSLVTNLANGPASNTCSFVLSGNWNSPQVHTFALASLWPAELPTDSNGIYTITGLDAYLGKLYITADSSNSVGVTKKQKTFFVLNLATPTSPTLLGSVDNDATTATGLAALHVGQTYAYTISALSGGSQLQIFDITYNPPKLIKTFQVSANVAATSIFYKEGIVYLGLANNSSGPEFYTIDVSDPLNPHTLGSAEIGSGVRDMYLHDNLMYVASGDTENIKIFDISNPASPVKVGKYISAYPPSGNSNQGNHIFVLNNTAYLGRTGGTNEFYMLDTSNPNAVSEEGSFDVTGSTDVVGLAVRNTLAFLATSSGQLQILNIADPLHITNATGSPITLGNPASVLDCEGNNIYVASNDSAGRGYITVVSAQ